MTSPQPSKRARLEKETLAFSRLPTALRRTILPSYVWPHRCKDYVKSLPVHPMTKVARNKVACITSHFGVKVKWPSCVPERDTRWDGAHDWVSICLRPTTHVLP
jgi:hypothetical protein